MASSENQSAYSLSPELKAAHAKLTSVRERNSSARAEIDTRTAGMPELVSQVESQAQELGRAEADRVLADDDQVVGLDAKIKKLAGALDSATRARDREQRTLAALEARMPDLDEEVRAAGRELALELDLWDRAIVQAFADELREAVRPLIGMIAKARAIGGMQLGALFPNACLVPDPSGRIDLSGINTYGMPNLAADTPSDTHAAAAKQISEALRPIRQAVAAATGHRDYVPLAKRPKPYVRRGYTIGEPAPAMTPPQPPRLADYSRPPGEEPATSARPTRGRTAVIDPSVTPVEMNMARAIDHGFGR